MDGSRMRRAVAWGAHFYTALGLPLALLAALALAHGDARGFFVALWAATFIDATDGALARWLRVGEVLPEFDGRRLDDLVDFLTYVFLPALAFVALDLLPPGTQWAVSAPLMASAYGFCQARAKTEESFVGFPSYWNVVAFYLYILSPDPRLNLAILLGLACLVFVPIHYLYPSKTRLLRRTTLSLCGLWAVATLLLALNLKASWTPAVAWASLVVPAYYFLVSLLHHKRWVRRQ